MNSPRSFKRIIVDFLFINFIVPVNYTTPSRTARISGLKYFEIPQAPSEIPANMSGQFSLSGQIFLHWAAATLKAIVEF